MSDLTREQIEERRRWIEATTVNPEYATVLCDMALRTLDAEDRAQAAHENWSHEVEHLGGRAEQAEERNRRLEADLSSLRGAYYAAIHQLQRRGAESVPLYPDPPDSEPAESSDEFRARLEAAPIGAVVAADEPAEGEGGDKFSDENKPAETALPFRELIAPGREHLTVSGTFQSDKYPTVPAGKVPLSVRDPVAQPLLWQYAQAHRAAGKHGDTEFPRDLEDALRNAGYTQTPDGGEGALEVEDWIVELAKNHPDVLASQHQSARNEIARLRREPRVPEAVWRLPEGWRATAQCIQDQRFGKVASAEIRRLRQCADDFDRALAQSEQGRAPTSEELHEKRREQRDKYRPSEGWKLVPVEPTQDMIARGTSCYGSNNNPVQIYKSMLAVAPQPQEGESDE